MANIRWKLNRREVRALMREEGGVVRDLQRRGEAVAAAAGPGHEVETYIGRNRARVTVRTATYAARMKEARYRNLSRAFEAARR